MKTDDLIAQLAQDARPVRAHAGERRLALALATGTALALLWVQGAFGLRQDLAHVATTAPFWEKVAMPIAVAISGLVVVFRLGHPGLRVRGWWIGVGLPVLLLWLWASVILWQTAPDQRVPLVMGNTWRLCVFNVTATAAPIGMGLLWALRGLAPTRPVLTGAAAGWLAGAVGACVYALHCPEMQAPFIGVWYVLGMLLSAGLGALAGKNWLKW